MIRKFRYYFLMFSLTFFSIVGYSQMRQVEINGKYVHKVDSVLNLMTIDEKIGQLNQYTGNWQATGPVVDDPDKIEQIKQGKVGSMLNIKGAKQTRMMQEYAMQSRLQIPMLFGLDVIHGLRTIYPIPLAEAASFNLDLMRRTAAGAAKEASAQGIHWTFAPMVDVSRDARWGRVMEGAGEDTWYGSQVAKARVKGFQGDDLSDKSTIMACAKHFAAYGAAIAGKDYNTVDISDLTLHSVYLPPFKAAVDANVASFMNAFNEINGIPSTGNKYIQRNLLKGEWGFNGLVVSDWGSIAEMKAHGFVPDLKTATEKAITAGSDIDMESRAYHKHLKELINEGKVSETLLNDAVRRVLLKKFELGLFNDPYRYCDEVREKQLVLSPELKMLSREAGQMSIVLLKNEKQLLPLNQPINNILVVGALANSQKDMMGFWANEGVESEVVSVLSGIKQKFSKSKVNYHEGYDLLTNQLKESKKILAAAKKSDIIIVAIGERYDQSGEAKSKADIEIPVSHQQLVTELKKSGKKVIVLLMGGRPMIFNEVAKQADAILLTWWLGTEAGNAIADVLAGDYNPSAKLPMTFPSHVGQVPIYYNYKNTGRPENNNVVYSTRYIDIDYKPAYPFGFGLSYTTFELSEPVLKQTVFKMNDSILVKVQVKNTGKYAGTETVQLYIRDMVSSVTRPVKELINFKQISMKAGETKEIEFLITANDLGFYNADLKFITEPGEFEIMVGANADGLMKKRIVLEK